MGAAQRQAAESLKEAVRYYWDTTIHDHAITTHPVGTRGFFQELHAYRFGKLSYLPEIIRSTLYRSRTVLEVGCGAGTDLVIMAQAGASVTGIDLSAHAIDLARRNFAQHQLPADLLVMDGEQLGFPDSTFDIVYAHGVLQYTPDPQAMVVEIKRVLKPGGTAILMMYNRNSWLHALSKFMQVPLEHADAPILRMMSRQEFGQLLAPFGRIEVRFERFPVPTRLHHGVKAFLYNHAFVGLFNQLPEALTRPLGWHLIALAQKSPA